MIVCSIIIYFYCNHLNLTSVICNAINALWEEMFSITLIVCYVPETT